jgi:hypothetical protein
VFLLMCTIVSQKRAVSIFRCFRKITKTDYERRRVCRTVCPSARNNADPPGRIFMKCVFSIFKKSVEKIQVSLKSDKNNGHFTSRPTDIYIFVIITWRIVLRMRNISDRISRENQNTLYVQ